MTNPPKTITGTWHDDHGYISNLHSNRARVVTDDVGRLWWVDGCDRPDSLIQPELIDGQAAWPTAGRYYFVPDHT